MSRLSVVALVAPGRSPYIDFGRVTSPVACAALCAQHKDGFTGSICK